MSKMIQIRNVPDDLHRTLKARAAKAGMSLSDYLLSEIEQIADKPTLAEMMERLRRREPVELDEPPDVTIRRLRDADDPRDAG
jgi:plasmid stability protein